MFIEDQPLLRGVVVGDDRIYGDHLRMNGPQTGDDLLDGGDGDDDLFGGGGNDVLLGDFAIEREAKKAISTRAMTRFDSRNQGRKGKTVSNATRACPQKQFHAKKHGLL